MQGKKRVSIFIGLIVISLIGISIVSASWFSDLFRIGKSDGLEGELETESATARVNVTGTAYPPVIYFVSKLNGSAGGADPIPAAGSAYFQFSFLACSPGGEVNLPDTQPSDAGKINASVNGTFGGSNQRVFATSCSYINSVAGYPAGTGCGGSFSKNYSCTIQMWYYYDPITWGINATLQDRSPVPKIGLNASQTFQVGNFRYWAMSPNYVNWSAIESGGSPAQSDNNLTIINQGNNDIDSTGTYPLQINGTNLMRGGGVENITADKFNISSVAYNPCSQGNELIERQYVNVINFLVNHSLSTQTQPRNNTLRFCLETVVVSSGIYETGTADSDKWTIRAFS